MDFKNIGLFKMINKKMSYLGQRQDVLAQNIANASTPGYRPHDLVPLDFKNSLAQEFRRLQPSPATRGASMKGTLPTDPRFRNPEQRSVFEEAPDGNAVVIEEQLAKVQETQLQFQTASNMYRKYSNMLKTALGRRGGA
ncbi:MAG: flagellar basal body rod protein FlgB [Alphaproteobacteria bacterium]|nr:flagellar basal body rod protein FlgB [Alphaproteobacteria bacterium]